MNFLKEKLNNINIPMWLKWFLLLYLLVLYIFYIYLYTIIFTLIFVWEFLRLLDMEWSLYLYDNIYIFILFLVKNLKYIFLMIFKLEKYKNVDMLTDDFIYTKFVDIVIIFILWLIINFIILLYLYFITKNKDSYEEYIKLENYTYENEQLFLFFYFLSFFLTLSIGVDEI